MTFLQRVTVREYTRAATPECAERVEAAARIGWSEMRETLAQWRAARAWSRLAALFVVALLVLTVSPAAAARSSASSRSPPAAPPPSGPSRSPAGAYPPSDSRYHDYWEMVEHIHAVAAAHRDIVKLFSIG